MNDEEKTSVDLPKAAPGKDWSKIVAKAEAEAFTSKKSDADIESRDNVKAQELPIQLLEHPSYKQLEADLSSAEAERDNYKSQLLLAKADFENSHKRFERDLANAHKYAIDKFAAELLSVVDSLERGLEIKSTNENQELITKLHEGMRLTLDLFLKILQKHDIRQINPLGEIFNPELHEAIAVEDNPNVELNCILKVVQKGYLLKDRLLRPALVIVKKSA